MNVVRKVIRKIKKLYFRFFPQEDHTSYVACISKKAPWIYIGYIADVFYHQNDEAFLNGHQNKREALAMVSIFNRLGYNVYVQDYTVTNHLPNIKNVRIIFGHSPAIEFAAKKYKKALVVFYATGCYYVHQNGQEKYITDLVNAAYGASFPYERQVAPYRGHVISDMILMKGSFHTIETYPVDVWHKVTTIHNSSQPARTIDVIKYSPENEYFFMSSIGVLLRGVSLLIEYFSLHQEKKLHLVCPIEPYLQMIQERAPSNIIFHGWLERGSDAMLDVMSHCNYLIYPSGSDASTAGSVINSMKNGLIPIVSKWAAFDGIDYYGYMMHGWDEQSIADGIEWAESISPERCEKLKKDCALFAKQTYNLDRFTKEFEAYFKDVLKCRTKHFER